MKLPIFPKIPRNSSIILKNTDSDNSGVFAETCLHAGINGSRFSKLYIKPLGTITATKLKIFLNNGLDKTNQDNNVLYEEISISAKTLSSVIISDNLKYIPNIKLPSGWRILVSLHLAVTTGINLTTQYADY